MKTKVVQIGNSKGIRIPKSILEECNLSEEVTMEVRNKRLIISSPKKSRKNWESEFKSKVVMGKDKTLDEFNNIKTDWDDVEWQW